VTGESRSDRWAWAGGILWGTGVALLAAAGLIEWLSPGSPGTALMVGATGIVCICVVVGAPIRRSRRESEFPSPRSVMRPVLAGVALMAVASVIFTLPPHSIFFAVFLLILGAVLFTFGVAMLGGGVFGVLGPIAAGLLGAALLMAPQRLALADINHTVNCVAIGAHFGDLKVTCPGPRTYEFRTKGDTGYEVHDRVRVYTDPHHLLKPMYYGQFHAGKDEVALILSLLVTAGIVAGAAINRRLRGGHPRRIIIMSRHRV
jgi:hypothetical protein